MLAVVRRRFVLTLGLFCLLFVTTICLGSETKTELPTVVKKIALPTRNVHLFLNLESTIQSAILQKNKKILQNLLKNDFSEYMAVRPVQAIPRDWWINTMLANSKLGLRNITDISTIMIGGVALVSFKLSSPNSATHDLFVLDVWQGQDINAKLAIRYTARASSPDEAIFTLPAVVPKKI